MQPPLVVSIFLTERWSLRCVNLKGRLLCSKKLDRCKETHSCCSLWAGHILYACQARLWRLGFITPIDKRLMSRPNSKTASVWFSSIRSGLVSHQLHCTKHSEHGALCPINDDCMTFGTAIVASLMSKLDLLTSNESLSVSPLPNACPSTPPAQHSLAL
jgi:hypothetical protein